MASRANEVSEELKRLAEMEVSPDAANPTKEFAKNPETSADPAEEAKKAAAKAKRERTNKSKSTLATNLANKRNAVINPEQTKFRKAISALCYIAAYVCNKGAHIDVATNTVKTPGSDDAYSVYVKQYGPSRPVMAIVMVPTELNRFVDSFDFESAEAQSTVDRVQSLDRAQVSYTPVFVPWTELPGWMLKNTNGILHEAPELFAPYTSKSGEITSLANVPSKNGLPGGSYLRLSVRKSGMVLVHSYRAKILTPENFVAMQRYIDEPIANSYTSEDATQYIQKYLSKLTKKNKAGIIKLDHLTAESDAYFSREDDRITACTIFPTQGKVSYFADKAHAIKHWCNRVLKTVEQNGVVVSNHVEAAVLPTPMISVKDLYTSKKEGSTEKRASFRMEKLYAAGATVSSYHWDAETFPNIFKALNNTVSLSTLEEEYTRAANSGPKKTTKSQTTSVTFNPSDFVGLTEEEIMALVKDSGLYAEAN